LIVTAAVVGLLIYSLARMRKSDYHFLSNRMADRSRNSFEVLRPCPLCKSMLRRGETVHSVVYSGDGSGTQSQPDTLAHLFGCRYCYPADGEHPRVCPVCGHEIGTEGYVVARMFERHDRKHIHVLGCTECRGAGLRRAASGKANE